MKTEELIEALAANLQPISPFALHRRLLIGATFGAAVTLAIVAFGYGWREDLASASGEWPFWRKLTFTLSIALLGLWAAFRASRPGLDAIPRALWALGPFAVIVCLALVELAGLDASEWRVTWLGRTWLSCPWSILALSVPVLIALLLAMRRLAPTRPAIAGLTAGLASGGLAATMYGLHCPEWAASFVATWYALGILASAVLGAVIGRRVLRW
jgi:hypothetical protein